MLASNSIEAIPLIEGIAAEHLLAGKGYDSDEISDEIVEAASARGMNPVIPPEATARTPGL